MKFKLHKIQLKIKKNKELFLLITLILITVVSMQIYNINKKVLFLNSENFLENLWTTSPPLY